MVEDILGFPGLTLSVSESIWSYQSDCQCMGCHYIFISKTCIICHWIPKIPKVHLRSGSHSRLMWNNGSYLMFRHIADLFYSNQEFALHVLPKLSLDHIVLIPYSKIKVELATQVLSQSVAIALVESGNEEVLGMAQFC